MKINFKYEIYSIDIYLGYIQQKFQSLKINFIAITHFFSFLYLLLRFL